jgi:hypothetical protein
MTLVVNGTTTFSGAGGNCSFCVINNGPSKLHDHGQHNPISALAFTINPDTGSGPPQGWQGGAPTPAQKAWPRPLRLSL